MDAQWRQRPGLARGMGHGMPRTGGEREGQGREEAKRHVPAHVRPVALEALAFSVVGGVPKLEINNSDRPQPCPPLDYLAYGRGIFQVVLALFFFRLGLMMQRWTITILQSDYSVDLF